MPRVSGSVEPTYIDYNREVRSIRWGQYIVQRPEWPVVAAWFVRSAAETTGILLLPGCHAQARATHIAFLQILDIETPETFVAYQEACTFAGHADILYRCVIERTPSGGAHIGFLCATIGDEPKLKLARRAADKKLLIELLQHQPCTVAPTRIHCKPEHPVGGPYRLVQGTWAQPHEISPAQRHALLDIARSLNEVPDKVRRGPKERRGRGQLPGDALNEIADAAWWADLLAQYGWRDVSRPGLQGKGIRYFQRPGKRGRAPSATLGACGPYFYVFSSNALPFDADTAYSPFSAYGLLEHAGNFTAAAKALAQRGYGTITTDTKRTTPGASPGLARLRSLPTLRGVPR
jgi:hypothetical protein